MALALCYRKRGWKELLAPDDYFSDRVREAVPCAAQYITDMGGRNDYQCGLSFRCFLARSMMLMAHMCPGARDHVKLVGRSCCSALKAVPAEDAWVGSPSLL